MISGSLAGGAICIVGHPLDTIKVRLQTQQQGKQFFNAWQCATFTVKNEGVRGLYKGMFGPLITVPLINAIVFSTYEQGKRVLHTDTNTSLSLWAILLAGGYAGLCNSIILSPIDVIKSRLQTSYHTRRSDLTACLRGIIRESGYLGIFRIGLPK